MTNLLKKFLLFYYFLLFCWVEFSRWREIALATRMHGPYHHIQKMIACLVERVESIICLGNSIYPKLLLHNHGFSGGGWPFGDHIIRGCWFTSIVRCTPYFTPRPKVAFNIGLVNRTNNFLPVFFLHFKYEIKWIFTS